MSKVEKKVKFKEKDRSKERDDKGKKKETCTCNHCRMKGHIKVNCWKKYPLLMPEKFKSKKAEKARVAVGEEHLLSMVNIFDDFIIFCVDIEATYGLAPITSINNGFVNVTAKGDIPDLEAPTECGEK